MLDSKCQKLTKQWNRKPSKCCCSHMVTFYNKFPGKCIMSLFLSSKERNNQMVGLSSEAHLEVITIATDHCRRLHCHRSLSGQQKVQKTTVPPMFCDTKECGQTILLEFIGFDQKRLFCPEIQHLWPQSGLINLHWPYDQL